MVQKPPWACRSDCLTLVPRMLHKEREDMMREWRPYDRKPCVEIGADNALLRQCVRRAFQRGVGVISPPSPRLHSRWHLAAA